LDVIKTADYVIDLGPDGGDKGGRVVASGTPETLAEHHSSYTGQYLKRVLADRRAHIAITSDHAAVSEVERANQAILRTVNGQGGPRTEVPA
ncbi:MAG: hypothetical protein M3T49_05555, partial [Candidatus Eremiobacteraeota bacterium]|nr:hypothetical protein [Candidatus Eremiobacteraeota bacterium]